MEKEELGLMREIERKIVVFLERNRGKRFNVLEISKKIKHGYPATLKYVEILSAKGIIDVDDYGNHKQVKMREVL